MPKLDYVFRSILEHTKWARELDHFVRRTVKRSLGLSEASEMPSSMCLPAREGSACELLMMNSAI